MIDCDYIKSFFTKIVLGSDKADLFIKIAENPERFTGLLRPSKPYSKVLQFLLQSHEIKFGNALEHVIEYMFKSVGFSVETNKKYRFQSEELSVDLILIKENSYYIVEMKVRDDHDSSKKRGQMENLKKKVEAFIKHEKVIPYCILYFVDSTFRKNRNYYIQELESFRQLYNTETFLFYGEEIFKHFGCGEVWESFMKCLKEWKEGLPDIPLINYDDNLQESAEILSKIPLYYWDKIVKNDELWEKGGVINSIFKNGETFSILIDVFKKDERGPLHKAYKILSEKLEKRVKNLYKEV